MTVTDPVEHFVASKRRILNLYYWLTDILLESIKEMDILYLSL